MYNKDEDLSSMQARLAKLDEIFRLMVENCENWREMSQAVMAASGVKDDSTGFKNVFKMKWPQGQLVLFLEYVMNFEMEKILWEYRNSGEKYLVKLFGKLRRDHVRLRRQFQEDIILQYGEDIAKDFLYDVLIKYLDPANKQVLLSYYGSDKSRRYLRINDNNNSVSGVGKKRKDWRNYDVEGAKAIHPNLCYWFNFFKCNRGNNCPYEHKCAYCVKYGHGVRYCKSYWNKIKKKDSGRPATRPRTDNKEFNSNNTWSSASNTMSGMVPQLGYFGFNNGFSNNNSNAPSGAASSVGIPAGMQFSMVPMMTPVHQDGGGKNNKKSKNGK